MDVFMYNYGQKFWEWHNLWFSDGLLMVRDIRYDIS